MINNVTIIIGIVIALLIVSSMFAVYLKTWFAVYLKTWMVDEQKAVTIADIQRFTDEDISIFQKCLSNNKTSADNDGAPVTYGQMRNEKKCMLESRKNAETRQKQVFAAMKRRNDLFTDDSKTSTQDETADGSSYPW